MAISLKKLLATLVAAAPLAGCATGPSYDGYGYDSYRYGYNAPYYDPTYVGPSVGLGLGYSDRDDYRHDRRDRRVERDRAIERDPRDGRVLRDYDGPGPGTWDRDGHGNLYYAPDGGKDARDANSASPG